VIKDKPYKH